jgi:hypothetical protein
MTFPHCIEIAYSCTELFAVYDTLSGLPGLQAKSDPHSCFCISLIWCNDQLLGCAFRRSQVYLNGVIPKLRIPVRIVSESAIIA